MMCLSDLVGPVAINSSPLLNVQRQATVKNTTNFLTLVKKAKVGWELIS